MKMFAVSALVFALSLTVFATSGTDHVWYPCGDNGIVCPEDGI